MARVILQILTADDDEAIVEDPREYLLQTAALSTTCEALTPEQIAEVLLELDHDVLTAVMNIVTAQN